MQLNRRGFLAGAVAAAPYFLSSRRAVAGSKNDRPLVAVVGTGVPTEWGNALRRGRSQGRGSFLGHEAARYADVVACCDVDCTHAESFAAQFGGKCQIYQDYRKLLERKDVEAVIVATPDHWHAAIAIAALRAGKDVYCEKPLTLTIDEGQQICRVVRETGRVFQVGTQRRSEYNGLFLKLVALVRSGRLGKRLTATATTDTGERGGPFPVEDPPAHLDWDMWLGQAPKVPYCRQRCHLNFRWWREYAGGEVTDWGAHFIDIAQWALGFEHTGPLTVEGRGTFPNIPNGYNVAETFDCKLTFAGGNTIAIRSVPRGTPKGVLIEGEKDRIFVNQGRLTGRLIEQLTAKEHEWLAQEGRKLCKGKTPGNHMLNFFECLKDRGEPISDVWTHHRTISSCHLCNIALWLGRKLHWDPVREDFVGDQEASRMLSRKQREPYTVDSPKGAA
jgi:myo-inositol 2-dehydrogenase / D-chiro-inositol 1-dehydrogenase